MKQVLKANINGIEWQVINRPGKGNQFYVYRITYTLSEYGLKKHRRLVEKYADLKSCLCHLASIA